ncbi:MAG: hypothetical protein PHW96_00795 [Candidatus Nanoarchaeia archaeon]|nr:hypothetical protein [Candidatus Nanoarchaeia archaeon]
MADKCSKCGKKIEKTFLDKIVGTYVKEKGELKIICRDCQRIKK